MAAGLGGCTLVAVCCVQDPLTPSPSEISQSRIKVYLRTISTNARHPRAALPELVSPIPFDLGSSFIQIVDDVVGMFFWVHGPGLIVWNWHTAEIIVVRHNFVCSRGDLTHAAEAHERHDAAEHLGLFFPLEPGVYGDSDRGAGHHRTVQLPRVL